MRTYPQFGQRSQRKHQMPDPASTSARQRRAAENVRHPHQRGRPGRRPGLPGPVAPDHERGFARLFCHHRRVQRLRPNPVVYLHSNRPELFESAQVVAGLYQL
ncbi:hypothetical protein CSC45_0001, partial [Pseudomonas aeruginosa]